MFSFLKNLFGTNNNENSANENIKKTIDTESLEKEFIQLKEQLSTSNDNNIIEILNKLGEVCTNLNKIDDAISYYEQSLKKQPTLGKASTDLLKLYNISYNPSEPGIWIKNGEKKEKLNFFENNFDKLLDKIFLFDKIMESLGSPAYRAKVGTNGNFILMHSVGSIPHGQEIDVPLNYADYYYLEALKRFMELKKLRVENGELRVIQ